MKIDFSKKVLIASVLVLVFVWILVFVSANLLYGEIVNINNKITQLKISAEERERALVLKDSIQGSISGRQILSQSFIGLGDIETANFIDYVESLAKKNNLIYSVRSVSYETSVDKLSFTNLGFLKIKLNVSGGWSNIVNFIQLVENLPKLSVVTEVALAGGSKNWSMDIEFYIVKIKE